jgi:hypothetical protein
VRECSSFSSSSCSTSNLADRIVFVQALVGSGCELYLAVMMMVGRVKDADGTIPANSNERFFVPCGRYIYRRPRLLQSIPRLQRWLLAASISEGFVSKMNLLN